MIAEILLPRRLVVGAGSRHSLSAILSSLALVRPVILTDPIVASLDAFADTLEHLDSSGVTYQVFAGVAADPSSSIVQSALKAFIEFEGDSLVAIGGGSSIDTAKAVSVLLGGGGLMRDHKVPASPEVAGAPVIAIPTTAGTGSEMTRFTIITDADTGEKMLINGPACMPEVALVDHEFTATIPFRVAADTGLDALTHAIEAYVSAKANPISDAYALCSANRVFANIRAACSHPDAAVQEQMMLGATEGGAAISAASVGLVHGMSRPLGIHFHLSHGTSNAMLLAAVTKFSIRGAVERYAELARVIGVAQHSDGDGDACEALVAALGSLVVDLDVPTPSDLNVSRQEYESVVATMAEQALASGSPSNNPVVPTVDQIADLYWQIY